MEDVAILKLPKIKDVRGNLSFFENENQIPFEIKRSYWIYDVPSGEFRRSHAFKKSKEFIVALGLYWTDLRNQFMNLEKQSFVRIKNNFTNRNIFLITESDIQYDFRLLFSNKSYSLFEL